MPIRIAIAAAVALVLSTCPAHAEDSYELRETQELLLAAWDHLQAAPRDEAGHRDKALSHITRALDEVHLAITGEPLREHLLNEKEQRRDEDLERKREERERKLDEKQRLREERLQER